MGFRKGKLDLGGGAVPQAANSGQAVGPEAALSRTQSLAVVLWAGGCHRLGPGWLLAAPFWQPPSGGFLRWPSPGSARGSGVGAPGASAPLLKCWNGAWVGAGIGFGVCSEPMGFLIYGTLKLAALGLMEMQPQPALPLAAPCRYCSLPQGHTVSSGSRCSGFCLDYSLALAP